MSAKTESIREQPPLMLLYCVFSLSVLLSSASVYAHDVLFPGAVYKAGPSPSSVATGDVNGDGELDIVAANDGNSDLDGISILLGNGEGGFGFPATLWYPSGSNPPRAIELVDVENDGDLDVITANSNHTDYENDTVSLLLGDGDGGFDINDKKDYVVGSEPSVLELGDLNNDGSVDLVTADAGSYTKSYVSVLLGDGAGGFVAPAKRDYSVDDNIIDLKLGDINADGILDMAMSSSNSGSCYISIMWGDGNGGFSISGTPVTNMEHCYRSISFGDLDSDSLLDLVGSAAGGGIDVLLGDGKGSFAIKQQYQIAGGSIGELVFMDNDENLDFVTGSAVVMLGDGAGGFGIPALYSNVAKHTGFFTLDDLDGDDALDFLGVGDGFLAVAKGDGFGGFVESKGYTDVAPETSLEVNDTSIAVRDVNRDGSPDLVRAHADTNKVSVMLGDGLGGFNTTGYSYAADGGPSSVVLGDVNGDNGIDIVTANSVGDSIGILLGNGTGGFAPPPIQNYAVGDSPSSVAMGDLDGDRDLDVVTADTGDDAVSVLLWEDTSGFVVNDLRNYGVGNAPGSVALGDLNSDSNLDLVAVSCSDNAFSLLLGDGMGGFESPPASVSPQYSVGECPYDIALGDIDNDSDLDVVTANFNSHLLGTYQGGSVSVLLGDGEGRFSEPLVDYHTVMGYPTSIALGDINGNGNLDIVTSGGDFGKNVVNILLGDGAGGFVEPSPWGYIAGLAPANLANLNGGRLDIVTRDLVLLQDGSSQKNSVPVVENISLEIEMDSHVYIDFMASDADGDSLSFILSKPEHGTVSVSTDRADVYYVPDEAYTGIDSFQCRASDGVAESKFAKVSITVKPPADTIDSGGGSVCGWLLACLLSLALFRCRNVDRL